MAAIKAEDVVEVVMVVIPTRSAMSVNLAKVMMQLVLRVVEISIVVQGVLALGRDPLTVTDTTAHLAAATENVMMTADATVTGIEMAEAAVAVTVGDAELPALAREKERLLLLSRPRMSVTAGPSLCNSLLLDYALRS